MFRDRTEAGQRLSEVLAGLELADPVVLALPRGGVPVAVEVARALDCEVDVLVARKVGAPGHEEYGIGAIAEGGEVVLDRAAAGLRLDDAALAALVDRQRVELDRRVAAYRGGRPLPPLAGRDIVLVDDGLATGVTAEASVRAVQRHEPRRIVLAVPVVSRQGATRLGAVADDVVCVAAPADFVAVGLYYDRFDQLTDDDVRRLLRRD